MDLINHYIKNESLVEIPTDYRKVLVEAAQSADVVENAICMAYNTHKMDSEDVARKAADSDGWKWLESTPANEQIIETGMSIVASSNFPDLGSKLIQYGTSQTGTNNYDYGSDTTPKTDLHNGGGAHISLKDDGAQLASPKGGEAAGMVLGALEHLNSTSEEVLEGVSEALELIEKDMTESASNRVYVKIGKAKGSFKDWYSSKNNPRFEEIKNSSSASDKQITAHLKKELALKGATQSTENQKDIIDGVGIASQDDIKHLGNLFAWAKSGDMDKAKVSKRHIERRLRNGANPEDFAGEALAEQVRWVVNTSMQQKAWKEQLENFFSQSTQLQTWVVYEAASGEAKFTGHSRSSLGSYAGTNKAVANKMMVWTGKGSSASLKHYDDIYDWSVANSNLCQNLDISFKGSGTDYYTKLGMKTTMKEGVSKTTISDRLNLEEIIKEEQNILKKRINNLPISEGLNPIKWAKDATKKLLSFIKKFFTNIIDKVVSKLKEWGSNGLKHFANMMGYQLTGSCKFGNVS